MQLAVIRKKGKEKKIDEHVHLQLLLCHIRGGVERRVTRLLRVMVIPSPYPSPLHLFVFAVFFFA